MKNIIYNSQICIENCMSDQDKGLVTPPNKYSTLLLHSSNETFSENLNSSAMEYNNNHEHKVSSGE